MVSKIRVFVASSSEGLLIADELQRKLQRKNLARVTTWPDLFAPSATTIETLEAALDEFDFGIFVLTPDDLTLLRGETIETARANVLVEFGLFMGHLGRARCFAVRPEGRLELPSDLKGMVTVNYPVPEDPCDEKELRDLIGPACTEIRSRIEQLGRVADSSKENETVRFNEKARNVFRELTYVLKRLTPILESIDELDEDGRLRTLFDVILRETQKIVNWIWQLEQVVVTVKTIDPNDPTKLICHHDFELLPEHRRQWIVTKGFPETIPRQGSLAGQVFDSGERQLIKDVKAQSVRATFSNEVREIMNDRIQSMAAWPLRRNGAVVAVLKLDATRVDLMDPDNEELIGIIDMLGGLFEHGFAALDVKLPTSAQ